VAPSRKCCYSIKKWPTVVDCCQSCDKVTQTAFTHSSVVFQHV
jgi:hypothetical protein